MERFIAVILSLVMALAIVGCSGNANAPAPTTHKGDTSYTADGTVIPGSDPKTWGPADESENVQIPNPWQECTSLEEAGKLAGFSFTAPETVDGYTECYIAAIEGDFVHAGILQPHGVDHAAGTLGDAGRGISKTGFFRGSLEGEGAKAVNVVQFGKLIAIAKGAGGGDDRVVQLDAAEIDAQASHRISSFRMTGPSLQMRLYPVRVLQEQPMQAPKPQPIRSSKLNWPEVLQASYTALSIGSGPQV